MFKPKENKVICKSQRDFDLRDRELEEKQVMKIIREMERCEACGYVKPGQMEQLEGMAFEPIDICACLSLKQKLENVQGILERTIDCHEFMIEEDLEEGLTREQAESSYETLLKLSLEHRDELQRQVDAEAGR